MVVSGWEPIAGVQYVQPTEEIRTVQIGVKRKAKVMKSATAEGCGTRVAPLFFIVPPYVT